MIFVSRIGLSLECRFIGQVPTCCFWHIQIAPMSHIYEVLKLWSGYMCSGILILWSRFWEWDPNFLIWYQSWISHAM